MFKFKMVSHIAFSKKQMYTIMKKTISFKGILLVFFFLSQFCVAQLSTEINEQISASENYSELTLVNVEMKNETLHGQPAIFAKAIDPRAGTPLILINDVELSNGIIELDIAGIRSEDSNPMSRGFLGIAFRISDDNSAYDCFYLRAANGRAATQLQRNHTVQYMASPNFDWRKLRTETPGKYETYVDMEPKAWTHVKIIVAGNRAEIYVHGATQPTMVVEELLGTQESGKLALWVGPGTDAYFANLKITKTK